MERATVNQQFDEGKENRGVNWGTEETKCLIRIWGAHEIQRQLDAATRKKKVWDTISSKMEENSYHKTGDACRNRMKNLKFTYKKVKDHNNKSGNDKKTSAFYDIMDEVMGTKPSITPPLIVDTSKDSDFQNLSEDESNEDTVDADNEEEDSILKPVASSTPKRSEKTAPSKSKKRYRENKFKDIAETVMNKMVDFQREQEEKMLALEEKRMKLENEAEQRREEREAKQRQEEREHEFRLMQMLMSQQQYYPQQSQDPRSFFNL